MPEVAWEHLPPKLLDRVADPGVFSAEGQLGLGPGWYHFGTGDDQVFLGHSGEADFYILDFDVTVSGTAASQGDDLITEFELGLDAIVPLNSFAQVAPGISFSTVAEGLGPGRNFDDGVAYTLVHLEFVGPDPVRTELADLGSLRFVDLV